MCLSISQALYWVFPFRSNICSFSGNKTKVKETCPFGQCSVNDVLLAVQELFSALADPTVSKPVDARTLWRAVPAGLKPPRGGAQDAHEATVWLLDLATRSSGSIVPRRLDALPVRGEGLPADLVFGFLRRSAVICIACEADFAVLEYTNHVLLHFPTPPVASSLQALMSTALEPEHLDASAGEGYACVRCQQVRLVRS